MEYKRESENSILTIILLIVVLFSITGYSQEINIVKISRSHMDKYIETNFDSKKSYQDAFFAHDKLKHFIGSMITTTFLYKLSEENFKWNQKNSLFFSFGMTASIGVGKEIYDLKKQKGQFSWKDLLANGLGIATGILLATQ
jgi:uncharacterized protein YfiM (DUF2279 family)